MFLSIYVNYIVYDFT